MYDIRIGGPRAISLMFTLFSLMGSRRRAKIVQCIGVWKAMPGMNSAKKVANLARMHQVLRERTHCKNGHPYLGDNFTVKPDGTRRCRICRKSSYEKYRLTEKAKENNRRQYYRRRDRLKLAVVS